MMKLMKWDNEEIIAVVKYKKDFMVEVTADDINTVVCGALEGGIGYWSCLDNTTEAWKGRDNNVHYLSDWATKIILEGGELEFEVDTYKKPQTVNLEKILKGIKLNAKNRDWDSDIRNGDVITFDCIFQYAMLGKIVFG